MCSLVVMVVCLVQAQVMANQVAENDMVDPQNFMDSLIDKLVDKLLGVVANPCRGSRFMGPGVHSTGVAPFQLKAPGRGYLGISCATRNDNGVQMQPSDELGRRHAGLSLLGGIASAAVPRQAKAVEYREIKTKDGKKQIVVDALDPDWTPPEGYKKAVIKAEGLPDGGEATVYYKDLEEGTGTGIAEGDMIKADYTVVMALNGKQTTKGKNAVWVPDFKDPLNIKGFDVAVVGGGGMPPMKMGAKREVYVGPELGWPDGDGCRKIGIIGTVCNLPPNARVKLTMQITGAR